MTEQESELRSARILIVDDDPLLRALLVAAVKRVGYQAVEAEDGEVAIQVATALPFDLLITDLVMPVVEGMELIRWFQKAQPAAKIIAISGAFHGSFLPAARLIGATAIMYKPFSVDALLATVRDVLSSDETPRTER